MKKSGSKCKTLNKTRILKLDGSIEQALLNLDYTNIERLSDKQLEEYSLIDDFEKNLLLVKNMNKFKLYTNLNLVKNLLTNNNNKSIKQAAIYFAKENIHFKNTKRFLDVQVAEPLLNENRFSFSLDTLSKIYIGENKEESIQGLS